MLSVILDFFLKMRCLEFELNLCGKYVLFKYNVVVIWYKDIFFDFFFVKICIVKSIFFFWNRKIYCWLWFFINKEKV